MADTTGIWALLVDGASRVSFLGLPTDKATRLFRVGTCVWGIFFETLHGVVAVRLRNVLLTGMRELVQKLLDRLQPHT
jgi:hypothetical protein